jgi:hypothetical protein
MEERIRGNASHSVWNIPPPRKILTDTAASAAAEQQPSPQSTPTTPVVGGGMTHSPSSSKIPAEGGRSFSIKGVFAAMKGLTSSSKSKDTPRGPDTPTPQASPAEVASPSGSFLRRPARRTTVQGTKQALSPRSADPSPNPRPKPDVETKQPRDGDVAPFRGSAAIRADSAMQSTQTPEQAVVSLLTSHEFAQTDRSDRTLPTIQKLDAIIGDRAAATAFRQHCTRAHAQDSLDFVEAARDALAKPRADFIGETLDSHLALQPGEKTSFQNTIAEANLGGEGKIDSKVNSQSLLEKLDALVAARGADQAAAYDEFREELEQLSKDAKFFMVRSENLLGRFLLGLPWQKPATTTGASSSTG